MARDLIPITTNEHGSARCFARIMNRRQATYELRQARKSLRQAVYMARRLDLKPHECPSVRAARSRLRTWVAAVEMLMGERV